MGQILEDNMQKCFFNYLSFAHQKPDDLLKIIAQLLHQRNQSPAVMNIPLDHHTGFSHYVFGEIDVKDFIESSTISNIKKIEANNFLDHLDLDLIFNSSIATTEDFNFGSIEYDFLLGAFFGSKQNEIDLDLCLMLSVLALHLLQEKIKEKNGVECEKEKNHNHLVQDNQSAKEGKEGLAVLSKILFESIESSALNIESSKKLSCEYDLPIALIKSTLKEQTRYYCFQTIKDLETQKEVEAFIDEKDLNF